VSDEEPPISISQLEAGGDIYIALGGGQITLPSDGGLPSLARPKLPKFDLKDAIDENGVDLFRVLRWDYGLVSKLHGRDQELGHILNWARTGGNAASARLITGPGGAGKTRLAAEAARRLVEEGWTAGFIPSDAQSRPFSIRKGTGLLLILDYPEERSQETEWLFRLWADLVEAPCPLRLLLLSRRGFDEWQEKGLRMEGRFGQQAIAALGSLTGKRAKELVDEATERFAALIDNPAPRIDGAEEWLAAAPERTLPLYAAAASVHAVLNPNEAFGLGGGELLRHLADRELRRVNGASMAIGLGEAGLARLLALGVLADGLTQTEVKALADAHTIDCSADQVIDRISQTPWWRDGSLMRLQPDKPAAAFVDLALFRSPHTKDRDEVPHWLFIALRGRPETLTDRLSRVRYDLFTLGGEDAGGHPLDERLLAMLGRHPESAKTFAALAEQDVSVWVAPLSTRVAMLRAATTDDPSEQARMLAHGANYLSYLGRREEALAAAEEAVELYRALASARPDAFTPNLAGSLNNLAAMLSGLGRREEALAAAEEAVRSFAQYFFAQPVAFAERMRTICRVYLRCCEAIGRESDSEILTPIAEALRAVDDERGEVGERSP